VRELTDIGDASATRTQPARKAYKNKNFVTFMIRIKLNEILDPRLSLIS
jgi:hypothetical protein